MLLPMLLLPSLCWRMVNSCKNGKKTKPMQTGLPVPDFPNLECMDKNWWFRGPREELIQNVAAAGFCGENMFICVSCRIGIQLLESLL